MDWVRKDRIEPCLSKCLWQPRRHWYSISGGQLFEQPIESVVGTIMLNTWESL